MRDARDVTVQRAIVHITDRKQPLPVYSEVELNLTGNGVLRDYFTGQVRNALDDEQAGSALFAESGPQAAKDACGRILKSPASFIASSQELARLLHAAMGTHHRIAPGTLAVCVYTASNYPSGFLALIKLDPGSALVQKVVSQKGKRLVSFDVTSDVMPTANEKLHKAALVPPRGTSAKYDLLLLDRQTADVAATFFAETFLNATTAFDGKSGAKAFYQGAQNAYSRLMKAGSITLEEADTLQTHIEVALQRPRVNPSTWPKGLPLPGPARTVIADELEKKLPGTRTISIDRDYVREKLLKKKRFRGDYGVLFEVEADRYDDVVTAKTVYERPDGTPVTRLTLEVPRLQWVKS